MQEQSPLAVIILGAGKGTRMKSDKAKVLHELFYAPMIHHVLNSVTTLGPQQTVVVVGHQHQEVMAALNGFDVEFGYQAQQLGTGHAVLCAEDHVKPDIDTVMILCGDTPLIRAKSLEDMIRTHNWSSATVTVMTTLLDDPINYGRIVCDDSGNVLAIVEEKDADENQKKINEINTGIYCVEKQFLFDTLKQVGTDNSQGEVYLTDIISLAVSGSHKVEKFVNPYVDDVLGVNSRLEMSQAHKELLMRRNTQLMFSGVTMIAPESISIDPQTVVGVDTTVHPGVHISGPSRIGSGCELGNGVILNNCSIGNNVRIGAYSCLDGAVISDNSALGPYTSTRNE